MISFQYNTNLKATSKWRQHQNRYSQQFTVSDPISGKVPLFGVRAQKQSKDSDLNFMVVKDKVYNILLMLIMTWTCFFKDICRILWRYSILRFPQKLQAFLSLLFVRLWVTQNQIEIWCEWKLLFKGFCRMTGLDHVTVMFPNKA